MGFFNLPEYGTYEDALLQQQADRVVQEQKAQRRRQVSAPIVHVRDPFDDLVEALARDGNTAPVSVPDVPSPRQRSAEIIPFPGNRRRRALL